MMPPVWFLAFVWATWSLFCGWIGFKLGCIALMQDPEIRKAVGEILRRRA